nr:D-alanyl-D-alanine carboxypeptidase family protein [uncultured Butyricicoccus sp.]
MKPKITYLMRGIACLLVSIMCITFLVPTASALDIRAASAFVMDAQTGECLYEYNGDVARVPASMTKVLTAYIVYQELEKGTLSWDTPISISHNVAVKSRDSSYPMAVPLTEGKTYTVDTLMHLIMIPSASASCIAMAEHISGSESAFVERMNQTAKTLGLSATYYNCHGARVNYITPRSQAMLTRRFLEDYPDILRITSKSGVSFNGKWYNNTNHLLNTMEPYEGLDGFKTGTISQAGYCVTTTAERNGRRVISVVMKSTSDAQRFQDSRQLLDYGFAEIAKRDASRQTTALAIIAQPNEVRPFEPFQVTAQLTGVSAPYITNAQWYVNDEPVAGYGNSYFQVTNGKTTTLEYTLDTLETTTAQIRLSLTMPDGTTRSVQTELQVAPVELNLDASLNLERADIYPGKVVTIRADVTSTANLPEITVPVQWELNGDMVLDAPQSVTLQNGYGTVDFDWIAPQDGRYELTVYIGNEQISETQLKADLRVA